MPGMHDDWMFDITTSRAAMPRDEQQQQAAPPDSHAAGRQHPAASQESPALTQASPVREVPASVKEAVDRFESWSTAQQSVLLPTEEGPAASVQPDEQSAPEVHSQQQREDTAVRQLQEQQQQVLFGKQSQQQQQPGLFENQTLPGEQHGAQQRQQTLVQQELPDLCPSHSLLQPQQQHRQQPTGHQDAGQQPASQLASQQQLQAQAPGLPQQQHNVRPQEQQQYKVPVSVYSGADSSLQESLPMSQNEPPGYKGSSHAVGLIDATLAAINDTQTGPAAAAPPPQIQPPAAVLADASGVGTKAAASVSSQRPLHAHTSGLTLSSRPGFADAFANPSLYQQPWLRPATKSDGASASGLPGFGSDHQHSDDSSQKQSLALQSTAAVGPFSAEASDRLGRTHQGSDRSTSHWATTLCSAPTNAQNSYTAHAGGVYHASEKLRHLTTAQKGDQQATTAPVAITSTNDRETTLHVPEGAGLRAAQAAYQEAKAASEDRKSASLSASRSGGAGRDEACTGPSRWSAVNAYRLAREAAERAAEGAAPHSEKHSLIMASA